MEWAWRESSPGPLLRASRPGSMALDYFANVCVIMCARFEREHYVSK